MAVYRAAETERRDAAFRDPFARALAGTVIRRQSASRRHAWAFVARTCLFDGFIAAEIARGVQMVVNLAAGVDARPYRMELPAALDWIEVDLPRVIDYKEQILAFAQPKCHLERVRLDLSDIHARRRLFGELGARDKRALVVSEGLVIYLTQEQVAGLASDLADVPAFDRWTLDLASPATLRVLQRSMGKAVAAAGAPFQFAPAEGPDFFKRFGWQPIGAESMFKAAVRLNRVPLRLRLAATLSRLRPRTDRAWAGVCLLQRRASADREPNAAADAA